MEIKITRKDTHEDQEVVARVDNCPWVVAGRTRGHNHDHRLMGGKTSKVGSQCGLRS